MNDVSIDYEVPVVWLYCLEIYRPFRKNGYGMILLQKARELCEKEYTQKYLMLRVEACNKPAQKLYTKFGFEFEKTGIGSLKDYEEVKKSSIFSKRYKKHFELHMTIFLNR